MWGFDPEMLRQLQTVRQLARLTHQTPTREWPLLLVEADVEPDAEAGIEANNALFVVREWPDGSVTAYTMPTTGSRS